MTTETVSDERLREFIAWLEDETVSPRTLVGDDYLSAFRELLALRAKVGGEGTHVMVPKEPTRDMKVAGIEAARARGNKSVVSVYRAMLDAATRGRDT